MRYEEVKGLIARELAAHPDGLTWKALKDRLALPYDRFCPEWTRSLESEIGLVRRREGGRALIWSLRRNDEA